MPSFRYIEQPPDADARAGAAMLDFCRRHLGVVFDARWYAPCEEDRGDFTHTTDVLGLYRCEENAVNVRAGLPVPLTLRVAAHEARHAWQYRIWGDRHTAHDRWLELDAQLYEGEAIAALHGTPLTHWAWLADRNSLLIAAARDWELDSSGTRRNRLQRWRATHYAPVSA